MVLDLPSEKTAALFTWWKRHFLKSWRSNEYLSQHPPVMQSIPCWWKVTHFLSQLHCPSMTNSLSQIVKLKSYKRKTFFLVRYWHQFGRHANLLGKDQPEIEWFSRWSGICTIPNADQWIMAMEVHLYSLQLRGRTSADSSASRKRFRATFRLDCAPIETTKVLTCLAKEAWPLLFNNSWTIHRPARLLTRSLLSPLRVLHEINSQVAR